MDFVGNFSRDGYVVLADLGMPNFDAVADQIIRDLKDIYSGGHRLQDAWRISTAVKELAAAPRILEALKLLFGREPFPFQTLNYERGSQQLTHSDSIHFDSFPKGFMAGVWVALEDVDAGNGPLHYYAGSHKLPHLSLADAGVSGSNNYGSYDLYRSHYEPLIARTIEEHGFTKMEAKIKRGQAIIWAANLLHGGSPITDKGRTRHSQVTHYYFDRCLYWTPLWSDPLIGKVLMRHPIDIRTGRTVPNVYCDSIIREPLIRRLRRRIRSLI